MNLNSGTCRIFIAIQLNDSIKTSLHQTCSEWKSRTEFQKWVHHSDYHITLKFLGDIDRSNIDAVKSAVENACAEVPSFSLALSTPGTFGQAMSPSILWYGVSGDVDVLRQLQRSIEETVGPLGYPTEKRAYSPHITLARRYQGNRPFNPDSVNSIREQSSTQWKVEQAALFQTHLGRQPMYEVIATVPLGARKNP